MTAVEGLGSEVDWQDGRVIERLIQKLTKEIAPWITTNSLTSLSLASTREHLEAAVKFSGSVLDGYVMARYLEDKRNWPANQGLVACLQGAHRWRELAIEEITAELRPKPNFVRPEMVDGWYPIGTRFSLLVSDSEYEIVSRDGNRYLCNRWLNGQLERQETGDRDHCNGLIKEHYDRLEKKAAQQS